MLPPLAVIDDSWRQSLLTSADSSFSSDVDESLQRPRISDSIVLDTSVTTTASLVSSTPLNLTDQRCSLAADSASLSLRQRGGRHSARTGRASSVSDSPTVLPTISSLLKRRRLKRRLSVDEDNIKREQLKLNLSQPLPIPPDNGSHTEAGDTPTVKRRRLKRRLVQSLPSDGENATTERGDTVVQKRRQRSWLPNSGTKTLEDQTQAASSSQTDATKAATSSGAVTNDAPRVHSFADNTATSRSASHRAKLCMQNPSTGRLYFLQPVVKASTS